MHNELRGVEVRIILLLFVTTFSLNASASDFIGTWQIKDVDPGIGSLCPKTGVIHFKKRENSKDKSISYSLWLNEGFSFWIREYYWKSSPGSFGKGEIFETATSFRFNGVENHDGPSFEERVALWNMGARVYISTYEYSHSRSVSRSRSCRFLVEKI